MGGVGQGVGEKSMVARDWESLVPFHSSPDLPLAPNTSSGHKATRLWRRGEDLGRMHARTDTDTESYKEGK